MTITPELAARREAWPGASPRICVPRWRERAVLRGAVSAAAIGAGRRGDASGPLLLAGLAGALATEVRAGDLVVGDELRSADTAAPCAAAPLLYGAVQRLGLRAGLGPLLSVADASGSVRRAPTATGGALATVSESAFFARPAAAGQTVALCAVVGTAGAPPGDPRTAWRKVTALRALRAAAPVMQQWAAAVGHREILLASPRSFCAGVERAVQIVERALQRYGAPVYVRRQIVHNSHVVRALQSRGAVFVDELDAVPEGSTVVLAAHGVAPLVRRDADARGLHVIDGTCPLVAKVHAEVRRSAAKGHTVFLIGHAEHEEVVGTCGVAPNNVVVVPDRDAAARVRAPHPDKLAYAMQTTLASEEAEQTAAILRERFPAIVGPRHDDICYATTNRQAAVREVARRCELVLVLGSQNSSNSHRLVEVAHKHRCAAYLVDDVADVDLRWLAGARRVGITAGASAPPHLVDDLVGCLSGLGSITAREVNVVDEDVQFSLPREVS
jgi:4-hydroxy-3-methylbut-2-enyl diphosphate reductase